MQSIPALTALLDFPDALLFKTIQNMSHSFIHSFTQ